MLTSNIYQLSCSCGDLIDSFTVFLPVESTRSQYLIFFTISSPCWPTLKRHSEQPELLFHTQFLWSHRAVSVVTPRDFTFLLPHSCKSEYFSFRASVLSGIYWRLSWKRRNVWERRNMSLLSQCRCDFCLWKMTFWNKFFHPDGFSFSRKMMENSATTLSHYAAVRSGKENSKENQSSHVSSPEGSQVSGRSVWRPGRPIIQHRRIRNWQEKTSNVSFSCVLLIICRLWSPLTLRSPTQGFLLLWWSCHINGCKPCLIWAEAWSVNSGASRLREFLCSALVHMSHGVGVH